MKRNMDLIRMILLTLEEYQDGFAPKELVIDEVSLEEIGFHIYIMMQAGLIEGSETTYMQSCGPEAIATSITWEGYDFLVSALEPEC